MLLNFPRWSDEIAVRLIADIERTIKHAPVNSVSLEILRKAVSLIMISASSMQYQWAAEPKI